MFKILVVDDEEFNRDLVKFALEEISSLYQFEVLEAEDGKEALEVLNENKCDIVFMDIMMPVMNGIEAVENIKNNPNFNDVIIIALTALDDKENRKIMFSMNVNDYISKPFDALELITKTKAYLSLKSMMQQSVVTTEVYKEPKKEQPIINIKTNEDLMSFWKCVKLNDKVFVSRLEVNSLMSLFYAYNSSSKAGVKIFFEKFADKLYFEIEDINFVRYSLKNKPVNEYDVSGEKIVFKLHILNIEKGDTLCDNKFSFFETILYGE